MICDDVCCERFAYIIMTVSNVGHCSYFNMRYFYAERFRFEEFEIKTKLHSFFHESFSYQSL